MKAEVEKLQHDATIGVLSTALSALFIPLCIPFGSHWALSDDESNVLAEALQKALSTLPSNHYADIKKLLDRYVPWVALTIAAAQIVSPRIDETRERRRIEREGESFPSAIEVPPSGYAPGPVRRRPDVDGPGPQAGSPDTFQSFPGAD